MITIFNRRHLKTTTNISEYAKIRDILCSFGIKYKLYFKDLTCGLFENRGVYRWGIHDYDTNSVYIFYVNKRDFEYAKYVLQCNKGVI